MFENATPTEIWILFFGTAIISGIIFAAICAGIWKIFDMGRSWIVWWNEDAGTATPEKVRVRRDAVLRGRGKDGKAYYLNARARKTAGWRSLWVVDVNTGVNLVGIPHVDMPAAVMPQIEAAMQREKELVAPTAGNRVAQLLHGPIEKSAWLQRPAVVRLQEFMVADPLFAFNKLRTNSYKNWFRSKEGEEDWRVRMAPYLLVGIIVMALMLGFVAIKYGGA